MPVDAVEVCVGDLVAVEAKFGDETYGEVEVHECLVVFGLRMEWVPRLYQKLISKPREIL